MNRKIISIGLASILGISFVQSQEIATWSGFRNGVATFTFDDGLANQLSIAVPIFDKYGYKASFYPVIAWNPNWSAYQKLVDQGYEVGSHSISHGQTMSNEEIISSKNQIDEKIKGQTCNTITYPNCSVPSESELSKYYIGGRICGGQVDPKTPGNYNRINSIICGTTGAVNSAQSFQQKMQEAINKNGWVTFLIHEVDNGSGYSPTSSAAIEGALLWASQNDNKIWVTTFRNAIMYSKERDASKIEQISKTSDKITYSLKNNLSTSISAFDFPLSVRIENADHWDKVSVTQNQKALTAEIKEGYIYFDAVPNGGNIEVSRDVVPVSYNITTTEEVVNLSAVSAKEGEQINFSIKLAEGYEPVLVSINSESVEISADNNYSFIMPAADVSISVYKQLTSSLNQNVEMNSIQVASKGSMLLIEGAKGKKVTILNSLGNTIKQTIVSSDNETVISKAKGFYLVKIENKIWNVKF